MDNNQNSQESNSQNTQNFQGEPKPRTEEFTINGDQLVARVKEMLHEGDIRQITIKSEDGKVLLTVPLTVGVAGAGVLFAGPTRKRWTTISNLQAANDARQLRGADRPGVGVRQ